MHLINRILERNFHSGANQMASG